MPDAEAEIVRVWRIFANGRGADLEALRERLSAPERDRADRFRFAPDAGRYVAVHAALAEILGGEGAGPALSGGSPWYSVTYAGDLALVAVSVSSPVGVDLEALAAGPELLGQAHRLFSSGELAALQALPAPERSRSAVALWTRKEAVLKAAGTGIRGPLNDLDVSGPRCGDWWIADLEPGPGHVGALATRNPRRRTAIADWAGHGSVSRAAARPGTDGHRRSPQ